MEGILHAFLQVSGGHGFSFPYFAGKHVPFVHSSYIKQRKHVICLPSSSLMQARPSLKRMGGIPFSLKLEGQTWQCIFHAFPLGAGQITHALPLGAGRHGFFCPLDVA